MPASVPYLVPWTLELLERTSPVTLHGRELVVERVARALLRRRDATVMLLGETGVGRTALLRSMARAALASAASKSVAAAGGTVAGAAAATAALSGFTFFELDVATLLTDVVQGRIGTAAVSEALVHVVALEKAILVVDEFHLLHGQCGQPLVNDMVACFRPFLALGNLRAVLAGQPKEYDTRLASDPLFTRRASVIYLDELAGAPLRRAVADVAREAGEHHDVVLPEDVVDRAVQLTTNPALPYRPPGSTARVLDEACVAARLRGTRALSIEHVADAARTDAESKMSWDRARLRALEAELAERVLGQPEAIKAVAKRIRLTKLQLDRKPQRPDGVFLFLGPSGVGKTELAKALAQILYGDLSRLVRLDMSEFMEQHEYSKLIGAPPGYLGYGEEGHLTGPVAKMGHAVVLFDEVEKAHPNCLRLMLQLFDEGMLTDAKGKHVDFSQCVCIMTSNLGRELWSEEKLPVGFTRALEPAEPSAKAVLDYLLKVLPSEFVNRIDDLVPFRAFSREDLMGIADKMMREEKERWAVRGKKLRYDDATLELLVDTGYNARLGARHLQRNLERLISQPLSERACQDDWPDLHTIRLCRRGEIVQIDYLK